MQANPEERFRTNPDFIVFDPTGGTPRQWEEPDFFWLNEQIIVVPTHDGNLLATWTSERLNPHLLRVACSLSSDGGHSWSAPCLIDGDGIGEGGPACWQVPLVSAQGRIYLFYCKNARPGAGAFGAGIRCRTSDDHGRTWSPPADLLFPRSPVDSPDADTPPIWITISEPLSMQDGSALMGFTRWAQNPDIPNGDCTIKQRYSHIEYLQFENLADMPTATDIRLRALNIDNPVTVPSEDNPKASFAQEPYTVILPDNRLFMVMRTNLGHVYYSISGNNGETWSDPRAMRNKDDGEPLLQPVSPCPIYDLGGGKYVFLFQNNDGYAFGAESRWDVRNRRPAYLVFGQFHPGAKQPIWWSEPELFIDNDAIPWGPPGMGRLEAATYPSLTITDNGAILWYPDRKGFLLGKRITR